MIKNRPRYSEGGFFAARTNCCIYQPPPTHLRTFSKKGAQHLSTETAFRGV